jgi:hypothetical protein
VQHTSPLTISILVQVVAIRLKAILPLQESIPKRMLGYRLDSINKNKFIEDGGDFVGGVCILCDNAVGGGGDLAVAEEENQCVFGGGGDAGGE